MNLNIQLLCASKSPTEQRSSVPEWSSKVLLPPGIVKGWMLRKLQEDNCHIHPFKFIVICMYLVCMRITHVYYVCVYTLHIFSIDVERTSRRSHPAFQYNIFSYKDILWLARHIDFMPYPSNLPLEQFLLYTFHPLVQVLWNSKGVQILIKV